LANGFPEPGRPASALEFLYWDAVATLAEAVNYPKLPMLHLKALQMRLPQ
jgi:hypothetical protein